MHPNQDSYLYYNGASRWEGSVLVCKRLLISGRVRCCEDNSTNNSGYPMFALILDCAS